jgi:hypothetical protein
LKRRIAWLLAGIVVGISITASFLYSHETDRPPIRVSMSDDDVSAALRGTTWGDGEAGPGMEGGFVIYYWKPRDEWFGRRDEGLSVNFSADKRVEGWDTYQSPWERPAWMKNLLKPIGL